MRASRSIAAMVAVIVVLGAVYVISGQQEADQKVGERPELWSAHMDDLAGISIGLPRQGKTGAWTKSPDGGWYEVGQGDRKVDARRWGGGIPLLLSGPKSERLIAASATPEQLDAYGLLRPRMTIDIALKDDRRIRVDVGDPTPAGVAYYVRLAETQAVYTVHEAWFSVLERLVLDPP